MHLCDVNQLGSPEWPLPPGVAIPTQPNGDDPAREVAEEMTLSVVSSDDVTDRRLAEAVLTHLRGLPVITPVTATVAHSDVVLVLARLLTEDVLAEMAVLATAAENPAQCMVLVTGVMQERQMARVIACGVVSILPRIAITPKTIVRAIQASAHGRSILSERATRWLVDEARAYHDMLRSEYGVVAGGLTVREAEVLRLLADGQDTGEIAERLHYSERTIKKIIQDLTSRLNLRNRTHAVSYALRVGAI